MARIFISYSRNDRRFVNKLVRLLRRVYGNDSVWYDDDIPGGSDWWKMILDEIAKCELFVYLISNDSLGSPYCQAELHETYRLRKQILPLIVRRKTLCPDAYEGNLKPILQGKQYVDMSKGFRNSEAISRLYGAINRLLATIPPQPFLPFNNEPVAQPVVPDKKPPTRRRKIYVWVVVALLSIVGSLILVNGKLSDGEESQSQETKTPAQAGAALSPVILFDFENCSQLPEATPPGWDWDQSVNKVNKEESQITCSDEVVFDDNYALKWTADFKGNVSEEIAAIRYRLPGPADIPGDWSGHTVLEMPLYVSPEIPDDTCSAQIYMGYDENSWINGEKLAPLIPGGWNHVRAEFDHLENGMGMSVPEPSLTFAYFGLKITCRLLPPDMPPVDFYIDHVRLE